jgi:hypothetical protein
LKPTLLARFARVEASCTPANPTSNKQGENQ